MKRMNRARAISLEEQKKDGALASQSAESRSSTRTLPHAQNETSVLNSVSEAESRGSAVETILNLMTGFEPSVRLLLVLRHYEGLPVEDAGRLLGLSEDEARSVQMTTEARIRRTLCKKDNQ